MQGRALVAGVLIALATAAPANGQQVRWNDRVVVDTGPEAPTVRVWLEETRSYSYGAPVRVWFNVSDDAYVVVARVDANGHLTMLYPSNRSRTTEVKGGEDIQIRGRRGAASFYATDRMGGGFVFAIASYDPFDLSRLGIRDFDRYVTGTYVGRPNRVYIGDPHRVITRFASMVLFGDRSPFDYAVDYYNVDAPYYMTSVGFSNFCNGYYGQYRRGLAERWDDELYYGDGFGGRYDCSYFNSYRCSAFSPMGWGYDLYGMGFINPLCLNPRANQPGGTHPPVTPTTGDSARAPGWLTDSVRAGRPDTVGFIPERPKAEELDGPDGLRRGTTVTTGPGRPISIGDDDPSGRSYAIPGRALRNTPTTHGGGRERDIGGVPGPDRISPVPNGGSTITWIRPPREVTDGPRNPYGDGSLPRGARLRGNGDVGDFRNGRTTFVTGAEGRPPVRAGGVRYDLPPRFDGPRGDGMRYSPATGGGGAGTTRGTDQVRASPVTAPPPTADAPRAPAVSGEKKPPGQ